MYPMIRLIPKKSAFFSCHCQFFFLFIKSIKVGVVHYIINEISKKRGSWRNQWDLFPPHSISSLLEKESHLHQSHCLRLSRYFFGLEYVQVPFPIFHSSLIILTIFCILLLIILTFPILTVSPSFSATMSLFFSGSHSLSLLSKDSLSLQLDRIYLTIL